MTQNGLNETQAGVKVGGLDLGVKSLGFRDHNWGYASWY